ncbi:MAG: DUF5054 domain-containing protein, partial [Burkholderiales bacterium]|nr:DUF5054 domain-containing protein [Anaerolineae bacterium]
MPILTDNQPQAAAKNLHLIFKTHLDIGFTDFSRSVAANYWAKFIPQAIETARTLRESGAQERFIWTTGSWLIYEYLEQAEASARKRMEDAILAGDIVWHGLPFTMHSELMDASLFRFGLSLSQRLDQRFGRKTIAAKMTDVPGHTIGIVPLLAEAGIEFLHIGVNPASTVPDVPPLFVWQHSDNTSIMVMYQDSYGSVYVEPRTGEAIAFAHTGDNEGPQTAAEVHHNYDEMRAAFPNTPVAASTLDAFAAVLLPIKSQLPVVTQEIGDTWIHGVGTDPAKVARFRELSRRRRLWLEAEKILPDDKTFDAFSRSLLMIPEHTWALDEKLHLKDYTHYEAASFQAARSTAPFQKMERSWAEQRSYIEDALNAIKGTPFGDEAERSLARLTPTLPNTEGFTAIDPAALIETVHFRLRFDTQTGAITELVDKKTGREWASPDNPIGLFRYQTFSEADYDHFYEDYIRDKEATKHWSVDDYTKPGMGS